MRCCFQGISSLATAKSFLVFSLFICLFGTFVFVCQSVKTVWTTGLYFKLNFTKQSDENYCGWFYQLIQCFQNEIMYLWNPVLQNVKLSQVATCGGNRYHVYCGLQWGKEGIWWRQLLLYWLKLMEILFGKTLNSDIFKFSFCLPFISCWHKSWSITLVVPCFNTPTNFDLQFVFI